MNARRMSRSPRWATPTAERSGSRSTSSGELDSSDISSNAQAIARTVPGARHQRFASTAHMINLEGTALFNHAITSFLASTTDLN